MQKQHLDPVRQEQAKKYAGSMHRLFLVNIVLPLILLLGFLFSGLSEELAELLDIPQPATVAFYLLILVLGYGIISAPLTFYGGFVLPHQYGLSHQTTRSWLFDFVKGGILSLILGVGVIVVIYWLLESFPETWWLFAAVLTVFLMLLLTMLSPLLVIPIFFKLRPLEDADLSKKLMDLAYRAEARIKGISVIDFSTKTTSGNAMLAGLGSTRRIILGDTVLDRYSADEIEVIVAHELGHHSHNDVAKLIGVQSALTIFGFYLVSLVLKWAMPLLGFNSIADIAAFPLLVLTLGSFSLLAMPFTNAYSRYLETAADEYALSLTDAPEALLDMLTKLTNQNLSDATPSRWAEILFYGHPPYSKRVQNIQRKVSKT